MAEFTKQLLAQFGIPIRFIRIESKAARSRQSGDVIHIDTENFAAAARLAGAEAAVLRPVFEIMEEVALDEAYPVIVIDWAVAFPSCVPRFSRPRSSTLSSRSWACAVSAW
ncbi:hypothetical protein QA640_45295 (plasmid) [Bradyrhizobium sp. CB82]|uniref:hypothetical protein n=1 Tax=Bradyrhizobium sp. CB82 TaxID=3039159 RepID=UPI0024B0AA31|nr:hypothetical protein [Bradyrhizobium sp. CB82]WFU45996.1 hypothetical protein QA640_45295 [Bradyrhizobium sp. CB82]